MTQPVAKDASVIVYIDFKVENRDDAKAGSSFWIQLPEQFYTFEVSDPQPIGTGGKVIANWKMSDKGLLIITFTELAQEESNVGGWLTIGTKFVKEKIDNNNPVELKFLVDGVAQTIEVDFEQPDDSGATIEKSGEYNRADGTVTWTLTVDPGNRTRKDVKVVDVLGPNQTFVTGSVEPVEFATEPDADGNLVFTFTEPVIKPQTITFKTEPTNEAFEAGQVVNEAKLIVEDAEADADDAKVPLVIDWISKHGEADNPTKQIHWTINVNNDSRNLTDAKIIDTLPKGLTLVDGSVKLDPPVVDPRHTYEEDPVTGTSLLTYHLGDISGPHTLTYTTDVDEAYFKENRPTQFDNNATLTWKDQAGEPPSAGAGVGVGTDVIRKWGAGYNPGTHEITWKVLINDNKVPITNARFIDQIPAGQEFVKDSFSVGKIDENGSAVPDAEIGDPANTGTLTYTFPGTITETYVITFKTRLTNPKDYGHNKNHKITNKAFLEGLPKDHNSTGEQTVDSQVIAKMGTGYDYETRELSWKIVVNKNQMELNKAVLTDQIPDGQKYVPGSFKISPEANGDFDPTDKGFTYAWPDGVKETFTITFKTEVTDLDVFLQNGDKVFANDAWLEHMIDGETLRDDVHAEQTVKNTVVGKVARYQSGKNYIPWVVTVNQNQLELSNTTLTDTLQEGLELDTDSVELYEMILQSNGTLVEGTKVDLGAKSVVYDYESRLFTFTFPNLIDKPYQLRFRTDVVDHRKSPFTNEVSFAGTQLIDGGESSETVVQTFSSGGGGFAETGSASVIKVDKRNPNKPLAGATFRLEGGKDQFGNIRIEEQTTDANGQLQFERLKFDREYTITEIEAPQGYVLSGWSESFTLPGAGDTNAKNPIFTVENLNKSEAGDITLAKVNTGGRPLVGAQFGLYNDADPLGSAPVMTATSDASGVVTFKNVELGKYKIIELKAPTGYVKSDAVIEVEIKATGSTVEPIELPDVVNRRIPTPPGPETPKGNIVLEKVDEEQNALGGAVFTLYDAKGDAVLTAVSGKDGKVYFDDLAYGKYTIKETQAPEGYILSTEEISVTINGSQAQRFTFENTKVEEPEEPEEPTVPGEEDPEEPGPTEPGTETPEPPTGGDEPETPAERLPQTGGLIDTTVLLGLGAILIVAGVGYAAFNRRRVS